MSRPADDSKNHGCLFAWCENTARDTADQRNEHYLPGRYIPATGRSLSRPRDRSAHQETLVTVGIGARFNIGLDPCPSIFLHLDGGWNSDDVDAELRLDEAICLYATLGDVIRRVAEDSEISVPEVLRYYQPALLPEEDDE
ncbi:hypothetical protein [Mycobacterium sp. 852014-52144_SCH5372336]|uniref:hypothetical protein n=1 Tax=Mycobacterium sp. 852014-52144_SCH5372336 TaxID=1834115 RepID=UPI0007FC8B72|nr:hypothetical protein [Mycobacterium sp. 852014-52144_SCH5372336]OBB71213.1 hypothetical protein A5759_23280 [Mycobacterium sp. 852014-52144_SCH5372336]